MMPVDFLVIRHGESLGNAAKKRSEKGDDSLAQLLKGTHTAHSPLTKRGREQARKTGEFLNRLYIEEKLILDAFHVSAYARALQTAGELHLIHAKWKIDPRITERDWAVLDRLTDEERHEKFGEDIAMRKVEPFFWAPPGGESFNSLFIRVRDFIDSVYRANVPTGVAVVCHGEVAKAFRINFCQMTPIEYAEMEFSEDSLRRIRNCQIDHYSRRGPNGELSERLNWLRICRPSEGQDVAKDWKPIPKRTFSSDEVMMMGNRLAEPFLHIDV